MGRPMDGEDKVASRVEAIVKIAAEIAAEVGSSLTVLEHNTRETFWWTSWAIVVVLGLFILQLLVRVRAQLVKLNTYQDAFHRMWLEDRANDKKDRNERRERYEEVLRGNTAAAAQARSEIEDYLSVLGDQADYIPEEGTDDYEEFVEDLREEMRRLRQQTRDSREMPSMRQPVIGVIGGDAR